ncbi:MAG: sigma factor, partial [Chitinophaga rupis]
MNERDYQALFEHSFHRLYGYTLKFVAEEAVCEEIVMDVMLRVWQKKELLQGPLSLSSYLFKAARNGAIDHLRKKRRRI